MRRRAVLFSAAGVLLAAGCGSGSAAEAEPAAVATTAPAAPAKATPSQAAPVTVPATLRFGGRTLDGARFEAATLAGAPAILWFWAPWCATCASEAQSIRDLEEEYRGRIGILGIAGMGGTAAMHDFVADLEVGRVTHLDDGAGKIWKRFKITQQSTYVLLDRAGEVVQNRYLDDLQLTAEVKSLVA